MTNAVSESTILPISEITILFDVNIRELDTDYVSELIQAQFEYGESHWQAHWKEKPKINQDGILFSGFHTITAAKRNFGNEHQVSFQVVEGDPYLLAACENAVHGKRRTNADKRAAVLRWLQDDGGRQWADSHIAKQCHVSDFLVNSVDVSLQENGSDTYDRPTKRKYTDKHGTVTWMETAKINDATGESEAVIAGEKTASEAITEVTLDTLWEQVNAAIPKWKKKREGVGHASKTMFIHATLKFHGLPHNSETNIDVLKKLLHLLTTSRTDILELFVKKQLRGESLWSTDDAAAETSDDREASKLLKKKNQTLKSMWDARKQAAADYVGEGDTDLNQHLSLPQLEAGFAKNHGFMADAFKSGMERTSFAGAFQGYQEHALESGVSLEDLEKEYQAIRTYAYDILTWERQEWIQGLIEAQKQKDQSKSEENLPLQDALDEMKQKAGVESETGEPVEVTAEDQYFAARGEIEAIVADRGIAITDFYEASKETHGLYGMNIFRTLGEIRKRRVTPQIYSHWCEVLGKIQKDLDNNAPWIEALIADTPSPSESDSTQQYQQTLESVQKFKEKLKAFGAPDDLVDDSLHFYQGIEETELSTRPQETLKQLNEFLQGFIEKPLPEWPEWIRHQVPEGDEELPGIDIHAMRNTLSSLLQTLGIDDSNRNLQELLGGDLLDVFLQYEELPTAKEQLIALLNTADAILSEMTPMHPSQVGEKEKN